MIVVIDEMIAMGVQSPKPGDMDFGVIILPQTLGRTP
jgi:hypothetical protein